MGTLYDLFCPKCQYSFPVSVGGGFLHQESPEKWKKLRQWAVSTGRNPDDYIHPLERIEAGEYGEELRQVLLTEPGAHLNWSDELFMCEECGSLQNDNMIQLYRYTTQEEMNVILKSRFEVDMPHTEDFEEYSCALFQRLSEDRWEEALDALQTIRTKVLAQKKVECKQCNGTMKRVKEKWGQYTGLNCPHCGATLHTKLRALCD